MSTPSINCRLALFSVFAAVCAVSILSVSSLAQGFVAPSPPIRWESDFDAAMARAEREHRPLFLHFYGNDCQPAQLMAVEVFSQPNIASHLNANFVMVRINASENVVLAQKFAVTSIPMDLILKPNRQLIHRRTGGISAERFSGYLEFIQKMLQSESSPVPPPSYPAANSFPTAISADSSYLQSPPPPFVSLSQSIPQAGAVSLQREMSSVPVVSDPFAQQSPFARQSPTTQPSATASTPFPPSNQNTLRVDDTMAKSVPEYMAHTLQVPANAHATPSSIAATTPSISAVMAELPAPAKMTVEVPLALDGFCPVTLCKEERWCSGNPAYCTMYQGHIFRFASAEALAAFARNPASFIPVAMGEDIVLMVDRNKRINGDRKFGAWYQERVFLFSSQESLSVFSERPDFYTEIALKYETARREPSAPIVY